MLLPLALSHILAVSQLSISVGGKTLSEDSNRDFTTLRIFRFDVQLHISLHKYFSFAELDVISFRFAIFS